MLNVIGAIICGIFIVSFIVFIILAFDKILTSFEKLEKTEKQRYDIIIKLIENLDNMYSQK